MSYLADPHYYRMRTIIHSIIVIAPSYEEARECAEEWLAAQNTSVCEFSLNRVKIAPQDTTTIMWHDG